MRNFDFDTFPELPNLTLKEIKLLKTYQTIRNNSWDSLKTAKELGISKTSLNKYLREMRVWRKNANSMDVDDFDDYTTHSDNRASN